MAGMTMRSQEETKTCEEQENESVREKCGSKQSLNHKESDVPMCMRSEDKDVGMKSKEIERTRGEDGGRHRNRRVEGDVPLCM